MRSTLGLAACGTLLAGITAQYPVAFPQDSTKTSSGNLVPLGFSSAGSSDEGRYQQLVPARNLPSTAGLIMGLGVFTIPGTGQVAYKSLKITLGTTTATALNTVFAANLGNPVTVFNKTNHTISYTQSTWVLIPFDVPFVYDGVSNLVVEIQKVLDSSAQSLTIVSHGTSSNPARTDTPRSAYAFGTYQSGASTATSATYQSSTFKLRLYFTGDTLTVGSDRGGTSNQVFALGGSITLTNHGTATRPFANFVSVGFAPNPLPIFQGKIWLNSPSLFLNSGTIGTSGSTSLNLPIPTLSTLIGANLVFQGATADPSGANTRVTNAPDVLINS